MHPSSYENMVKCCFKHVRGGYFDAKETITVVDMGAADVNGSYRAIFDHPKFRYIGFDTGPGPGVDHVLEDPYRVPLADGSADIVVSGQMLEHAEFFWLSFQEMMRIVSPDGFVFLIAPSAGGIHRYPVDCYRFYPDAYHALARHAGCDLVDLWHDDRGPWNDLVGVFRHRGAPGAPAAARTDASPWMPTAIPRAAPNIGAVPAEAEVASGRADRDDVLAQIHAALAPRRYLEIGVGTGRSLAFAKGEAVGVDPAARITEPLRAAVRVIAKTSDQFFDDDARTVLANRPDLTFIDGMHLFEFALRDFMNAERCSLATSAIVVDDIFPNHELQAERRRRTRIWTGDVWKILACLRRHRTELVLVPIDARPTGLLLVAGLDRANTVLRAQYNPLVGAFAADSIRVPADILGRTGALAPDDARIADLLALLRQEREAGAAEGDVAARLRQWREAARL
jgi:SAM-dependent methyltransferase